MGEEGANTATAPDFQMMLRKVQETDYHTSAEEQGEVASMGWDINFPPHDTLLNQAEAEIDSVKEELTTRAINGELSEAEATRQLRTFAANRYEKAVRQLMALYDSWKRQHFPTMLIAELFRFSLEIDRARQDLRNQRRDLGL
jgi:hypothetical protein